MHLKANIEQLIKMSTSDGCKFLINQDGEWIEISEHEYNKIIEGE